MQASAISRRNKRAAAFYAQGIVNFVPGMGVAGRLLLYLSELRKAVRGATVRGRLLNEGGV